MNEKIVVFGGHYGSEGKGAAAEFHIERLKRKYGRKIAAFGENSPNSGHTCSAGKTKNIPASSFFANVVILGPDAVIDLEALTADLTVVRAVNPDVEIYIHEHAAWMSIDQKREEAGQTLNAVSGESLVARIGSTASGSGKARSDKYFNRDKRYTLQETMVSRQLFALGVRLLNRHQWMHLVNSNLGDYDWIFECSQGVLLDTNWGVYPFVTSRTTLPQAALHRNGLGMFNWHRVGVYRTYPIRTGGNSGPTGGRETSFEAIGQEQEIATVTKRKRRVFEFCPHDFALSMALSEPHTVMLTHGDYTPMRGCEDVGNWLDGQGVDLGLLRNKSLYVSFAAGMFELVAE